MESVAVRDELLYLAVMFADVVINTSPVFTGNVALLAPGGTVTLEGTLAAELLLVSATRAPPAGAAALSVTVPVEDCSPPTTVAGFKLSDATVGSGSGGFTVSVAVLVVPPYAALIVTAVDAVTALVLTVKLAVVAPAATVTLAGTRAAVVLLLESETAAPPDGAALPAARTATRPGQPPALRRPRTAPSATAPQPAPRTE